MIRERKNEHLDIVLSGRARGQATTGFEEVTLEHRALPELRMDDIDLGARILGKPVRAPFMISAMTGGPDRAGAINLALAEAAREAGIAMAVGSQRIAIEQGDMAGLGRDLRRAAPDIPLFGNFGAVQLTRGFGVDEARRVVDMIGADALILHFNPLQEAVQPEGDRDWRGILRETERLARALEVPLIAKEVGAGLSADVAARLVDAGFAAIDVAGAGGTSWALIEAERAGHPAQAEIARAFANWGEPTARLILAVRARCPGTQLIASGGVLDGVDAAKALRLGADLVGLTSGFLAAATQSTEAVLERIGILVAQLRVACFCTGARDVAALRAVPARFGNPPAPLRRSEGARLRPARERAGGGRVSRAPEEIRAMVEARLAEISAGPSMAPPRLEETTSYALLGSSKRLRPILLYLIADPDPASERAVLTLGCAVELAHTASLMLDDLPCMDDASLRRRKPSTHRVFGEASTILGAIALLSRGFELVARLEGVSDELRARCGAILAEAVGSNGLAAGQQLDLGGDGTKSTREDIERINWLKTGVLFEATAVMGGVFAGLSPARLDALRRFARHFGLAFQTADDLIDRMSTAEAAGKDVGRDAGKSTLVTLLGPSDARGLRDAHLDAAARALRESGARVEPILAVARAYFPEWRPR